MEMVKRKKLTLKAASQEMQVSYRQGKRIYKRYLEGGGAALAHGNKGKKPYNKTDKALLERALERYKEIYNDFGPTLAAEKLKERDGIVISVSSLRRGLIKAGLWEPSQDSVEYRSRRQPREKFGELVQFDGSHHRWFEDRGPKCC
jgi:transposase